MWEARPSTRRVRLRRPGCRAAAPPEGHFSTRCPDRFHPLKQRRRLGPPAGLTADDEQVVVRARVGRAQRGPHEHRRVVVEGAPQRVQHLVVSEGVGGGAHPLQQLERLLLALALAASGECRVPRDGGKRLARGLGLEPCEQLKRNLPAASLAARAERLQRLAARIWWRWVGPGAHAQQRGTREAGRRAAQQQRRRSAQRRGDEEHGHAR